MLKNHNGFTLIESIIGLYVCIIFCLFILPLAVTIMIKAEEAEERYRMYGIAYDQVKVFYAKETIEHDIQKDGGRYSVELSENRLCVSNAESDRVCVEP
ncbi:hypothetical protein KP77_22990 [Jeotgalibacillus alimentarius]|uniref:Type II secretion system protein n=1 Tax=Jeotgalibacillus alimentarius TaxID=135826 RepID=A0A0C2VI48_9BACL|nr:type II secretion system protein [Jeotgalibacillus alimentarius]KIL48512.1 hypothetical protein KP77_22990 [Jeotgalibacillus alimentarius]